MKKLTIILLTLLVTLSVAAQGQKKKAGHNDEAESLFDYAKEVISSDARFNFAVLCSPEVSIDDTANCLLSRAISEIKKMKDIAVVVVIGNITKNGLPEEIAYAHNLMKKSELEYLALPGNRDLSYRENGGTDFKRIFGDDSFRSNINGVMFLGINTSMITDTATSHLLPQNELWLKSQLKSMGKKAPILAFTSNGLTDQGIDNWHEITNQLRKYNTQLCINAMDNSFGRREYDQVCGYSMETVKTSYLVGYVRGAELFINRKELGGSLKPADTIAIEAKMYLEPKNKKEGKQKDESLVWQYKNPYAIYTGATVGKDYCYFGDDHGMFYCIDLKKGKVRWKYQTVLRIVTKPVVVDDRVLFGGCDRNLYCLNAITGEFIWKVRTEQPVTRQPIIEGENVYIDKNDSVQYTIDLKTGEEGRPRPSSSRCPHDNGERITAIDDNDYITTTIDGVVTRHTRTR